MPSENRKIHEYKYSTLCSAGSVIPIVYTTMNSHLQPADKQNRSHHRQQRMKPTPPVPMTKKDKANTNNVELNEAANERKWSKLCRRWMKPRTIDAVDELKKERKEMSCQ